MSIYNEFDACNEFCIIYIYIIVLYILPYIYILLYTLFDKFIVLFHNSLCFSKNVYLILNKRERNFKVQLLHFLKGVLSASHHAVHECFSKKNMSRLNMHVFKR